MNLLACHGNILKILLILALTLPFKTPFFFNTFIWVLIGGLNRETSKYLDTTSGGLFLHVSANLGRSILDKILENTPLPKEVEEKPLEAESQIAEPESLSNPSQTLAVLNPEPLEKEETLILD